MNKVTEILTGGNGNIPVVIKVEEKGQPMMAPSRLWITKGDGRVERLIESLGVENVKLVERK